MPSRLARIGGVYPIGSKVATVNVAGYSWDLYKGPNGSMTVFSFIPSDGSWKLSFNADVKQFFTYLAQNQGYPINSQNLIGKWP
jgi:xyloglucan-specific endo-beta-1,4-glucanase